MKIRTRSVVNVVMFVFVALIFEHSFAFAGPESDAVKTMAKIVLRLNHHPSGPEMEVLRKITKSESASKHETVLAGVLMNLEHKASSADKKKLKKILNDKSASHGVHDIASILIGFHHKPSGGDKQKMQKLIQ